MTLILRACGQNNQRLSRIEARAFLFVGQDNSADEPYMIASYALAAIDAMT